MNKYLIWNYTHRSKALEALDILLQHIETEADWSDYEKVKNAHTIVEQALVDTQEQELVKKALINGIWNGVPEHIQSVGLVYMLGTFYLTCFDENGKSTGSYPLSEYKITWWLKKYKSE